MADETDGDERSGSRATEAVVAYDVLDAGSGGAVAVITLDRPGRRNGYTLEMSHQVAAACARADADDDVRAVVLTGRGEHFCMGADLGGGGFDALEVDSMDGPGYREPAGRSSMAIYGLDKPVVAALRGYAVGAGSTIVLPCDYRIAGEDVRFGFVFTRRGIVPEGASTWFLPRLVGLGRAMDWMVSGRVVEAEEALAAGLVHELHPPGEVLDRAIELARSLAATTAPVAVALTRRLLFTAAGAMTPEEAQAADSRIIGRTLLGPDAVEGITAFLEKRPARWPTPLSELPDDLRP
jgi:enoyl-CoA hydratase/carnithine racemase